MITKVETIKKEEELVIRFEGDNEIDLYTLRDALNGTVDSIKIIADRTLNENEYCKFRVTKIEKGSFIINIASIIESVIVPMLPVVPSALNTFKTCLDIKKHLKGEKPKKAEAKGNVVEIENNYGETRVFNIQSYNVYCSEPGIEKGISKLFNSVNKDESRSGMIFDFNLDEGTTDKVSFDSNEVKDGSIVLDLQPFAVKTEEEVDNVYIRITKIDFESGSKWQGYLHNNKVLFNIKDTTFLDQVHNGEVSFSNHTKLKVELKTVFELTNEGLPDTTKKPDYSIIKVLEINNDIFEEKPLLQDLN